MKLNRFNIGDQVFCKAYVEGEQYLNVRQRIRRIIRTEACLPVGVICGATRIQEGKVTEATGFEEDFIPGSFEPTKTVWVWIVKTGLVNKPYLVLDEDLEPRVKEFPIQIPIRDGDLPWRNTDRETWREAAAILPRDEKGRWKSRGPSTSATTKEGE